MQRAQLEADYLFLRAHEGVVKVPARTSQRDGRGLQNSVVVAFNEQHEVLGEGGDSSDVLQQSDADLVAHDSNDRVIIYVNNTAFIRSRWAGFWVV